MRLLILGGGGMLGHQLLSHFKGRHDVRVTLRLGREAYGAYRLFEPGTAFYGVDAKQTDALVQVMAEFRPEAVLNAVGVIKQRSESKAILSSLEINSL
ncbi:MAG: NAD-dependent epimerase/dehydratase family protein, partial [Nitrospira sp.]|nr:NAD-dependent epimerase/dehydratase family protein [Nitrospira sp.]